MVGRDLWQSDVSVRNSKTEPRPTSAPIYWSHEAITYLGLDRLGLARPDMALQRLVKKDALRPRKINGRLAFDKEELDRIVEKADPF